jgi:hypothetical protein
LTFPSFWVKALREGVTVELGNSNFSVAGARGKVASARAQLHVSKNRQICTSLISCFESQIIQEVPPNTPESQIAK